MPSIAHALRPHPPLQHSAAADAVWGDQAEREARGFVALLFVGGGPLRRADLAAALRVSAARVDRACAFLRASPPHGLALLESGDEIQLTSAPDCGPLVKRFLDVPRLEPLSQAALEVLSIVAYEQPVTRAEISHIRATDSSGVIETLLARELMVNDPRFGGRPLFLVTTAALLRTLGLGSLAELPPRPALKDRETLQGQLHGQLQAVGGNHGVPRQVLIGLSEGSLLVVRSSPLRIRTVVASLEVRRRSRQAVRLVRADP